MLALGFHIDPTTTSLFFCKFRVYIIHVTTLLSRFYIVLACADRWAMTSTSVKRRAFSQIKVAKILIPVLGMGICIISVHILLFLYIVDGEYRIFSPNLLDKLSVILVECNAVACIICINRHFLMNFFRVIEFPSVFFSADFIKKLCLNIFCQLFDLFL